MKVGLFIPCYIDQFYPQVGLATVDLLEQFGCEVVYPEAQTCCGQPMANTGCVEDAKPLAHHHYNLFQEFEYVVCPSGSCTSMVRNHYANYFPDKPDFSQFKNRTYELCEFLTDILKVDSINRSFPHRVGIHQSCHGLRELRMGKSSELVTDSFNKVRQLLELMDGIEFTELKRPDECCGFGGTFSITEEAVSCMMAEDRIQDHEQAETEIMTAADMSCLMHLGGVISRQKKDLKIMHVAEILAGYPVPGS
jgi:L-lactate dehydrogenase complex protein LldE